MTAFEKEYGTALYSLAEEERLQDEVLAGLELTQQVLRENPQYPRLLQNPALSKEERLTLLDNALRGAVHPYVLNFCKLLCGQSALGALEGAAAQYRAQLYEARGLLPVTALTAVPLSEAQQEALCAKLRARTGKTILLTNTVDARVLGGVKLTYAGREMDGSAAGRLAALRDALMA